WASDWGVWRIFGCQPNGVLLMRVDVVLMPAALSGAVPEGTLCVMVDVLRTSTTFCAALAQGAEAIVPFATQEAARRFAEHASQLVVMGGEQHGRPIPGFALENSPLEYTEESVSGKLIAFVSSNGVPLLYRLPDGETPHTVVMGLVNRAAVAEYCRQQRPDQVLICCAGDSGAIAYEDVLGAGALVAGLCEMKFVALTDAAHLALAAYREAVEGMLASVLRASRHARFLALEGKQRDIEYATRLDVLWIVPRWYGRQVVPAKIEANPPEEAPTTTSACAA
ncbi:MAG: 2-phosphosulfolactate phosphatase, partial [Candidatus Kapabacteria bacterium]|nr:2-phosphosulfolactate phosphatase [Candidatus Kapabacteria bacterium]MDW7996787.1 2-phosphosulfolactate phosphatase [Bacteroidota bacterium]